MPTQLDSRQVVNRSALSMIGNAANEQLSVLLPRVDAELAKLFEDRNILLQNGGIITFTGTQIQFTENLEIVLNQKISGAAPQVISLGMANVNLNNNEMWYAVINRTAGTATTSIATSLPAATSANQEIFLIAKRVDAGDGTQRVYWRNGMALNAGQSVRLGASGAGDGGDGILEPIPGYRWLEVDKIDVGIASADSKIQSSITRGTQNLGSKMITIVADRSRTVSTSSGVNITISGTLTFTVQTGDILYLTSGTRIGQWRRIVTVNSQTSFVLDAAFTGGDATPGDGTMLSQAVWTKDLVNLGDATQLTRARDQFSGNITQIAVDYLDSVAPGDAVPNYTTQRQIVVSASNSGLVSDVGTPLSNTFSPFYQGPAYPNQINDYVLSTNATQQRLHLVFFCSPTSISTSMNLLRYEVSFYADTYLDNGGSLESAFAYSDGSGTEVNCSAPSVVSGKTRLPLSFSYIPGVNAGRTRGQLQVYVDGLEIPRFVSGATLDAFYTEIQDASGVYNTIEFHTDLSSTPVSIEVVKGYGVIDSSNTNSTRISALEDYVAPSLIVKKSAGNNTSTGTEQDVTTWTTVVEDNKGWFNTSTGVYTVQEAGLYLVHGIISFDGSATGVRWATIHKNGVIHQYWTRQDGSANGNYMPGSAQVRLAVNDAIKLRTFQNSGGNLAYSTDSNLCVLNITKIRD